MFEVRDIQKEIVKVGGQYAVANRNKHPSAKHLVAPSKSGKAVFDVEMISDILKSTLAFVESCGKKNQIILFVSTRKESIDFIEKIAKNLTMPYVLDRWIGGMLSNFKNIRGRVDKMERMRKERLEDKWTKNTKKEKVLMDRTLSKLESKFGGISSMERLPSAIFILDTQKEKIAVNEAKTAGVPIIGFSNANADLNSIEYPIVANIQSRDAVSYILKLVEEAYLSGAKSDKSDK